jgi:hypothetical protein
MRCGRGETAIIRFFREQKLIVDTGNEAHSAFRHILAPHAKDMIPARCLVDGMCLFSSKAA